MDQIQRTKKALSELGIHSVKELNEAIKKTKPLDISMMAGTLAKEKSA